MIAPRDTHRFEEGGHCAKCGQLWPCQPILRIATALSESTALAAHGRELAALGEAWKRVNWDGGDTSFIQALWEAGLRAEKRSE